MVEEENPSTPAHTRFNRQLKVRQPTKILVNSTS
uniref:Uncharacterized protein n=1 Tax=Nelumbo nucifera TaxID=4432 RepID=A0A822XL52_NELNU|nr:TPA_asm: hypothetical protein HUJ06_019731 [Nelumbo nucifera]